MEDGQKRFKYHSPTVMLSIRGVIPESLLHASRFQYSNPPFSLIKFTIFGLVGEGGGGGGQNGNLRAFAEYFKNGSADFHQTYVTF